MSLLIDIPYCDKDEAKLLGAKWNPELKKWFIKNKSDYPKFSKWIVKGEGYTTILCDYFYIVLGVRKCFKCHKLTNVMCFAVKNFLLMGKSQNEFDFPYEYFHNDVHISPIIKSLPEGFLGFLNDKYKFYFDFSKTTGDSYFANHCDHCGMIQGNYYLFEEPDSPFYVDSVECASELNLFKIKLKYDLICDLDFSIGSDDYLIEKYAKLHDTDIVI